VADRLPELVDRHRPDRGTAGAADGVVDFHAALRDPSDPDRLRPDFDSGDHLHPSAAGWPMPSTSGCSPIRPAADASAIRQRPSAARTPARTPRNIRDTGPGAIARRTQTLENTSKGSRNT